jgi:hypothetical protein
VRGSTLVCPRLFRLLVLQLKGARGAKNVFNRIPGDAKLYRKIRRSWLPPNGELYLTGEREVEARKILTQVHGYMDMHEARYGYIVSDEELIFLRRRPGKWGQLDISPAIRHNVKPDRPSGTMNSLYVLFYLHWKVANDDGPEGWRLESYGKDSIRPLKVQKKPATKGARIRTARVPAKRSGNPTRSTS